MTLTVTIAITSTVNIAFTIAFIILAMTLTFCTINAMANIQYPLLRF